MSHDGTVDELWRYPAKSMMGERLRSVVFHETGVLGDRMWALVDEVRGGVRGAKKIAGLMRLSARYANEPDGALPPPALEVTLPGGEVVSSADPDVNARLSLAVDHPVRLEGLRPSDDLDHYRRGAPDHDDLEAELRDIFGRTPDEPLPDFSVFPPEIIEYESPPGTYFDAYPLLVMTRQSLATLARLAPESAVDVRRFRPSMVLDAADTGDERWPEMDWIGRTIAIGDAELDVVAPCPRCVMITRPFAELEQDRALLRTVVAQADQNIGVYATVKQAGSVGEGDPFAVRSSS